MANPNGNPSALIPAPPGNVRGWKHGAYSERLPELRVEEIVQELLSLPHVHPEWDRPAAEEIARLRVTIERVDSALADGRVENKRGQVRTLIDQRRRLSAQLERWYSLFGMVPHARADWTAKLSGRSVNDEIRRRLEALDGERDAR